MTSATVEVRLTLAEGIVQKLREMAQAHGVTEEAIVEQALDLLFGLDDTPLLNDYWFSVAAMREDWELVPEDWIADEVADAVPAR
ncbi:MAG: hypothetical protein HY023_04050 [Chloroflexi bacterium]|nr:hypothetical protein [Chloroflexota bacterium]